MTVQNFKIFDFHFDFCLARADARSAEEILDFVLRILCDALLELLHHGHSFGIMAVVQSK